MPPFAQLHVMGQYCVSRWPAAASVPT